MKRKILFLTLMSVLLFVINGGIALAADMEIDIGPEHITLKTTEAKKPAEFPHRKHQQFIGCMSCHHTKDRVMNIKKCRSCHNKNMNNQKLNNLKRAGHKLCKDCHKASQKAGRKAPTKCSSCHPLHIKK